MPSPLEEQRVRYIELQKILEGRHHRPFSYAETVEIGRSLVKLVTVLAAIEHRRGEEQRYKDIEESSNM